MATKACAQCGEDFEAKRSTAKYCGDRCRQQARRTAKDPGEPVPRIVELTTNELQVLGKLDTVLGEQALTIARRLEAPRDTGSAVAALSRELDRLMLRVRSGVGQAEDQLSAARRRRDEARQAAARAAEA